MLKTDISYLDDFQKYFETKKFPPESIALLRRCSKEVKELLSIASDFEDSFVLNLKNQEGRNSYFETVNKRLRNDQDKRTKSWFKKFKRDTSDGQYFYFEKTLTEYKCFFSLSPEELMSFVQALRYGGGKIVIYLREDIGYRLSISYDECFIVSIHEEFAYEYNGILSLNQIYELLVMIDSLTDELGNMDSLDIRYGDMEDLSNIEDRLSDLGMKKSSY